MSVSLVAPNPVYALPDHFPAATKCWQIQIPDDPYYAAQLVGSIERLSWWFNYERDNARTGKRVAALWSTALRTLRYCDTCTPCPTPTGPGFDEGDDFMIRQDPDNPCLVKMVCPDGSLGCVVIDLSLCDVNKNPGIGPPPPAAGKCADYALQFKASEIGLLTPLVSTGDTITFISVAGAGSDGTPNWYCPDGSFFIGGACLGGGSPRTGDPLPSTNHMAILLEIAGVFYPATVGTFTVPAGVSNASIHIQVNDASLTDNSGQYTLKMNICNNQAPPSGAWCYAADLTLSPSFGSIVNELDANGQFYPFASWVHGTGFICPPGIPPPATLDEYSLVVVFDLGAPTPLTYISMSGLVGVQVGGGNIILIQGANVADFSTGASTFYTLSGFSTGGAWSGVNAAVGVTCRYVRLLFQGSSASSMGDPAVTFNALTLKGSGVNPFGTSNC